jgi:hypothetical protein
MEFNYSKKDEMGKACSIHGKWMKDVGWKTYLLRDPCADDIVIVK